MKKAKIVVANNKNALGGQDPVALRLAEQYASDWCSPSPDAIRVELPFQIRPESGNVQHFLLDEEFLVVRADEPYGLEESWTSELQAYQLSRLAKVDNISIFGVPEGLVTLSAVMNDAISGNPNLIKTIFGEIGAMARNFRDQSNKTGMRILPDLHLADIAFIKGRHDPVLLPPLTFVQNNPAEPYSPIQSLSEEIISACLDEEERQIVLAGIEEFNQMYTIS